MKKLRNKGFTLIELLIVITLLGILAVAVLSAINPVEQMNRSRDTASRSDAEQLINACDRYYATVGRYVWRVDGKFPAPQVWQKVDDTWEDTDGDSAITKLSAGGTAEVKESFVNRVKNADVSLYVYNKGSQGDSTYVCFVPRSSAFTTESGERCDATSKPSDYPDDACPTGCSGTKTCYSCLP